jgi:hypothetical protein
MSATVPAHDVTIVITLRERYSSTADTFANVRRHAGRDVRVLCALPGAPPALLRTLVPQAEGHGIELLTPPAYLTPNQLRNMAWNLVRTPFVLFVDNDARLAAGSLQALLDCAHHTGAWLVGPLYVVGEPTNPYVHMAGGRLVFHERHGRRVMLDEHVDCEMPLNDAHPEASARPVDYVEFHCMLARTDVRERVGPLDEGLCSLQEHIDVALMVRAAGGEVWLEPRALASYVPPPPAEGYDLPYFQLRWSEAWNAQSVERFLRKWSLDGLDWHGDPGAHAEPTMIRFGRAQRRLLTGLEVSGEDTAGQPLERARMLVALLQSVDVDLFELHEPDGSVRADCTPEQVHARLLRGLDGLSLRPLAPHRPHAPVLCRLDDAHAVHAFASLTMRDLGPRPGPEARTGTFCTLQLGAVMRDAAACQPLPPIALDDLEVIHGVAGRVLTSLAPHPTREPLVARP